MPTATFEYTHGSQRATSFIREVASLADAEALATALLPYTNAAIPRVGWTISSLPQHPEKTGDFADLDSLGITIFRDTDNRIVKLVLPAPVSSSYDITAHGYEMKKTVGDALAVILGGKTGQTLTFQHGTVVSKHDD